MGTILVLVSYLCAVGEARAAVAEVGAATWEVVASFAGSAGSGGTSRVPWPGGGGGGPRLVLGRRTVASSGLFHDCRLIEEGFTGTDGFREGGGGFWCFVGEHFRKRGDFAGEMWVSQGGWFSIYRG